MLTTDGDRSAARRGTRRQISAIEPLSDDALDRFTAGATEIVRLADDEVLIPGLVDTPCARQRAGPHRVGGLRVARPRAAAAGGVTTIIDMPLNSIPPTSTSQRCGSSASRRRASARSTWVSGAARCPATSADLEALHDAGVFGFKCFLLDSGVPRVSAADRPSSSSRR